MKNNFVSKILKRTIILGTSIICILYLLNPFMVKAALKSKNDVSNHELVKTISTCFYFQAVSYVKIIFKITKELRLII